MPTITWDDLSKNQTDPETIEEAIARIVAEHNADASAHLGDGQSLQSHRASEIIDHAIGSFQSQNEPWNQIKAYTIFPSLDGIDHGTIAPSVHFPGVSLNTEIGVASTSYLTLSDNRTFTTPAIYKNLIWQSALTFDLNGDNVQYAGFNGAYEESYFYGAGFKYSGGHLYAITGDNSGRIQTDLGVYGDAELRVYRVQFFSDEGVVRFYVNNQVVHEYEYDYGDEDNDMKPYYFVDSSGGGGSNCEMEIYNMLISHDI